MDNVSLPEVHVKLDGGQDTTRLSNPHTTLLDFLALMFIPKV